MNHCQVNETNLTHDLFMYFSFNVIRNNLYKTNFQSIHSKFRLITTEQILFYN